MKNGFSLVELLVATAVTLMVSAGVLSLVGPARAAFSAEPEVAVVQQRLRVMAEALFDDLVMAGAGQLNASFAPVLPFRRGAVNDAGAGVFKSDTITLYYVPSKPAQTTLATDLEEFGTVLKLNPDPSCPQTVSPCGFTAGMDVLVFDEAGSFGRFTVTAVRASPAELTITPDAGIATYRAGSRVVQAIDRTYFLKNDPANNTQQLMSYDGSTNADLPVVDHVVGLTFEYFGDPQPPALRTVAGQIDSWATYGPKPPAFGVQSTAYPAGENCVFQIDLDSGQQVPRLPLRGDGSNTLVRLTAEDLTDGPWCPDAAAANRWDADLLRIRKISVTMRVEAAIDALRGPAGALFARPGTSRGGPGWVPDQEIRFQVSPRNLNRDR
jgi:prepilin-type N-terminal cleavage/methylation domain-containing protein